MFRDRVHLLLQTVRNISALFFNVPHDCVWSSFADMLAVSQIDPAHASLSGECDEFCPLRYLSMRLVRFVLGQVSIQIDDALAFRSCVGNRSQFR